MTFAEEFLRVVQEGGADSFFVSSEWLFSLPENETKSLAAALSSSGYSAISQTSTTTLFARIGKDKDNCSDRLLGSDNLGESRTTSARKVSDNLKGPRRAEIMDHPDVSEPNRDPTAESTPGSASGSTSAEEFLREVQKGGEDGFFVSSTWLLSLKENERKSLMSALSSSGYAEISQSSTTTLFAKLETE